MATEHYGVTIPTRTVPIARLGEYARLADDAGFHSAWDYHMWRDPYCMLMQWAEHSERMLLGTGVAMAFGRSPMETACAAHDVDELSGGRMLMGLGTGVPEVLASFHSADASKPVARMREYIDVVRLGWQYLMHGEADPYVGAHYRFVPPPYSFYGVKRDGRDRIPIYIAALNPRMMRLVGEKADGWIGYLASPKFVAERVLPGIAEGALAAGRDPDAIDVAAEIITSVSPDREVAMRRARIHVGTYLAHPVSDVVVKVHGLEEEQGDLRRMLMTEGPGALEKTPDKLVEAFSICGTPEEARQRLAEHSSLRHLVLHTPYVPPLTWEESEDAYYNLIDTFKDIVAGAADRRAVTA